MLTWRRGRQVLRERLYGDVPAAATASSTDWTRTLHPRGRHGGVHDRQPGLVPNALLHNIKHNKVLHERVVLMTVRTEDVPYVPDERAGRRRAPGQGLLPGHCAYGFMEEPDVPAALELCRAHGLADRPDD